MGCTVIGAGGFVGRRLAETLRGRGAQVWTPGKGDPHLMQRPLGVVYYCAGLTADYDQRPFDTVEAHASLVSEIARIGRFERLVYCSSTRLYDGQPGPAGAEDGPLLLNPADPRHTYDLSKALGENLTLTRTDGRGTVARLANVYDWTAGSPGFLSEWLIRARAEREFILDSSPHVARDYIHLDDVVSGLIAMGEAASPPGVVNVASGELVTNGDIAAVFEAAGWRIGFSRDGRPASPPNVSAERLVGLGVAPRPVREVVGRYLAEEPAR